MTIILTEEDWDRLSSADEMAEAEEYKELEEGYYKLIKLQNGVKDMINEYDKLSDSDLKGWKIRDELQKLIDDKKWSKHQN